ncbi:MAG: hypothetical protein P8X73_07310 [Ignavibacteriaceae bacterium]
MWIYVDQKEFNKAIELGETALEEFPDSRYFKRGLARAYEDVDPNRSIDLYNVFLILILLIENKTVLILSDLTIKLHSNMLTWVKKKRPYFIVIRFLLLII